MEMFLAILGLCFIIAYRNTDGILCVQPMVSSYLTPERIANFISFFAIIVGVYTTVWVVLATSVSKFSKELLKVKIDKKLFFVIVVGLIESSFVILLCMFIPPTVPNYEFVLILFVLLSLISFVKFIYALMMLTKLNIRYIIKEFDENEREKLDMKLKVDDIHQITKSIQLNIDK